MDIYEGQITALLGHSGSGKTALLNVLSGFSKPSAGEMMGLAAEEGAGWFFQVQGGNMKKTSRFSLSHSCWVVVNADFSFNTRG